MHFKYVHFVLYQSYPREAIKMLCVLLPNCCEFVAQSCADAAVFSLFFPEVEWRKEEELGHFAKVTFISDVNWPALCLLTP